MACSAGITSVFFAEVSGSRSISTPWHFGHPSRLAFYNPRMRFVTEPGAFTFSIGASSADIRAEQTVTLDGQIAEYRQREIVATKVAVV